jgi:DNA-binding PadR family transcriptional regulator
MPIWFDNISNEAEVVANLYRASILAFLTRGPANPGLSWSQLLEKFNKSPKQEFHMNPRAFDYHIKRLVEAGFVTNNEKQRYSRGEDRSYYAITQEGMQVLKKHGITEKRISELISYIEKGIESAKPEIPAE